MTLKQSIFLTAAAVLGVTVSACGGGQASSSEASQPGSSGGEAATGSAGPEASCGAGSCGSGTSQPAAETTETSAEGS